MANFYLSKRKRKDGSICLYAVKNEWDEQKKKQVKAAQIYIGCKRPEGTFKFNEATEQFVYLLRGTEFERPFYQWSDYIKAQKAGQNDEQVDPVVDRADRCIDLNGGVSLLLDHVAKVTRLKDCLVSSFGDCLADQILSLAYYCASCGRGPLYGAAVWSESQKLPGDESLTEKDIASVLHEISASDTLTFLQKWLKRSPRENRVSLDITSVSSYAAHNPDVMPGYNRDREKMPQINLLMMTDQVTKLPVWFEQLPGAISDMTTVKDTIKLLEQLDDSPRSVVCDRGFATAENIACMQKHGFKFTMGIPLHLFPDVRKLIRDAVDNHEFSQPGITLDLFDLYNSYPSQGITKLQKWNGHRVYIHLYYCADYKNHNENELMDNLNRIQAMLERGQKLVSPEDIALAEECFTVSNTPKRGRRVKCDGAAVDRLKRELGGYFAIVSNQLKDCHEAMYVYKLRDGVEKRFDDLKNEEDCHRLRVHTAERMRARLLIQFVAEILRCYILHEKQQRETEWKGLKLVPKTVNDVMRAMASLRYIHIEGHHPFYKRPTRNQLGILKFFGIETGNRLLWPSLASDIKK